MSLPVSERAIESPDIGVPGTTQPGTKQQRLSPATWMSLSYTIYFAAVGCFVPFLGLYYRQLGLSGQQIGVLSAIGPLATALLAPLWGAVADLYGTHRLILRLALAPTILVILLMSRAATFGTLLPLVILHAILLAPVMPFMDGYGVAISERYQVSFGKLRFGGTVGFIVTVFMMSAWMGNHISAQFLLAYAGGMVLTLLITFGLPAMQVYTSRPDWRDAVTLLRRPPLFVLLLNSWVMAIGYSTLFTFFSVYMGEIEGAGLIGTASMVLALSELPILFYSNQLIERLGVRRMLVIGMIFYAVRLLLYSVVTDATWVIPIQLLHCLSYTFYMLASVRMAHRLGGSELAATAQSLLASSSAFGSITGILIGGVLFDWVGVFAVFRTAGLVVLLALGIFLVGMRWVEGKEGSI